MVDKMEVRPAGFPAWQALTLIGALLAAVVVGLLSNDDVQPSTASPSTEDASSFAPSDLVHLSDASFVSLRTGHITPLPQSVRSLYPAEHFQISPDGSRFAFIGASTIYVARTDGTRTKKLASASRDSAPSWSPNGQQLVFNDGGQILIVNVRTGLTTRVVHHWPWVFNANFSPDGRHILFTRATRYGSPSLWTVPTDGGSPELVLRRAAFGAYSPDGTSIAFRRGSAVGAYDFVFMTQTALWMADEDGSNAYRVPGFDSSAYAQTDPDALRPVWSPDGTRVAYVPSHDALRTQDGQGVYVHYVNTGVTARITDGARPSWLNNNTLLVEEL